MSPGLNNSGLARREKACSQLSVTRATTPRNACSPGSSGLDLDPSFVFGPGALLSWLPGAQGASGAGPLLRGPGLPLPLPPPRLRAAAGRGHVSAARRGRGPGFRAAEGDAAAWRRGDLKTRSGTESLRPVAHAVAPRAPSRTLSPPASVSRSRPGPQVSCRRRSGRAFSGARDGERNGSWGRRPPVRGPGGQGRLGPVCAPAEPGLGAERGCAGAGRPAGFWSASSDWAGRVRAVSGLGDF